MNWLNDVPTGSRVAAASRFFVLSLLPLLEVASVKKRMKDKAFARTVNRADLWGGAEELGLSFDEHCAFVMAALREIQEELGLRRTTTA